MSTDPFAIAGRHLQSSLRGPRVQLALASVAAAVLALGVAAWLVGEDGAAFGLVLSFHAAGTMLALRLMRRSYPHGQLGLCNLVTLLRMALTAALLAPLLGDVGTSWAVFAVAAVAFALDGVDGWLARLEGRASAFGARFDMEVDSSLALILALNAWLSGAAGIIVLAIALPRYAFAAAALAFPWLDRPLPERFGRKAVCVLQIGTLIALQAPQVTAGIANPLVLAVLVALAWSFGRDTLWLWRART